MGFLPRDPVLAAVKIVILLAVTLLAIPILALVISALGGEDGRHWPTSSP